MHEGGGGGWGGCAGRRRGFESPCLKVKSPFHLQQEKYGGTYSDRTEINEGCAGEDIEARSWRALRGPPFIMGGSHVGGRAKGLPD